ncbi:MAG: UbiX family flavin prenyltransferase [Candidatus Altiarchaeales archaeon]|nr:UbiX family flavin prenyltransferase [Candidatus Altiarchaeales archaeon]MBD3415951.1 UbiX family flavin prenyltransferase [Candidatus Altiarchaeales archaeon]
MKVVVAVTGASGVILAEKLLKGLKGHETHLIVSEGAVEVAGHEGVEVGSLEAEAGRVHGEHDMFSPLASSSNRIDSMVVIPCTMKTLSAIANGYADNLISRSAENVLKMGGRLVVVPRDTPLTLAAIENMRRLKLAGAIILPPNIGFYHEPKSLDDMTGFITGKVLDALQVEHNLYRRWQEI